MKINLYTTVILSALLGLTACNNQSADSETEIAIPVSVEELRPGFIEQTINTTGTVVATKEATLTTEMAGRYTLATNPKTGKPFMLGDRVNQGQVIVKLEDEEYVNNLGMQSKELNLKISEQNYTKQKSLFDKGGVTQSELSNAEVSAVNARDSYELAKIQMEKMNVRAPFGGVITQLPYFTQGTKVTSGTEVVSLMSYEKLQLEVNLPEKYINQVEPNQDVRVMNYTLPEDTLHGMVRELSPAISTETRTFTGKLSIDNDELKLRPGMFVQAEIVLDRKDSVIVIPKEVIISNQRGKSVFVVEQGTAEQKQVTLGYENQDKVEITSGLKANDRLVVKGFETLRARSKVKIIK
ncbi:efflux RND transporter periplasmic adaptor subunit [uncultured Sunxiuqinia sp.]|uniref:efflux RND transporter periplasmic adaptor subunit n=1 Tax=Sunxiuqinia rutila TaxID=1397841 RepID=UPI00262A0ABE|nr:efflux RND transporter periplasmic adaptor subunit [uncultured Sunxiuqinia sp.]